MSNKRRSIKDFFQRSNFSSAFEANNSKLSLKSTSQFQFNNEYQIRHQASLKRSSSSSSTVGPDQVNSNNTPAVVTLSSDDENCSSETFPMDSAKRLQFKAVSQRPIIVIIDEEADKSVKAKMDKHNLNTKPRITQIVDDSLCDRISKEAETKEEIIVDFDDEGSSCLFDLEIFMEIRLNTSETLSPVRFTSSTIDSPTMLKSTCDGHTCDPPSDKNSKFVGTQIVDEENNDDEDRNNEEKYETQANSVVMWRHFRTMLEHVLSDDHFKYLMDSQDWTLLCSFGSLTIAAQQLLVRLLSRKHRWLHYRSIRYDDIDGSWQELSLELKRAGFILGPENLNDLEEALWLFHPKELRQFVKQLNGVQMHTGKRNQIQAIVTYAQSNQTLSYAGSTSLDQVLLRQARKKLDGQCASLNLKNCRLFYRLFLLHYMPGERDEEIGTLLSYQA